MSYAGYKQTELQHTVAVHDKVNQLLTSCQIITSLNLKTVREKCSTSLSDQDLFFLVGILLWLS